jgi:hypothetical protein
VAHEKRVGRGGRSELEERQVVDPIPDRPIVHCLVARPIGGGEITRTLRVPLSSVPSYVKAGWNAVGPDPGDISALAKWEREHGNTPGWWQ